MYHLYLKTSKLRMIFMIYLQVQIMKQFYKKKNTQEYISFDDAYQFYYVDYKPKYIASKRYFEKFISEYVREFIVYGTFISQEWYMNE